MQPLPAIQLNQNAQTATPATVTATLEPTAVPATVPVPEQVKQLPAIDQIKLDALKAIAREHKLTVNGTKAVLYQRIADHFASPPATPVPVAPVPNAPAPVAPAPVVPTGTTKQLPPFDQTKLDALKAVARDLKLKVGGSKAELYERIANHYAVLTPVLPVTQEPAKPEPGKQQLPNFDQIKLDALKKIARGLKIKVSGTKVDLYQRITDHYAGKLVDPYRGRSY